MLPDEAIARSWNGCDSSLTKKGKDRDGKSRTSDSGKISVID
jgi:hypothetical protein